jgi:aconitase B
MQAQQMLDKRSHLDLDEVRAGGRINLIIGRGLTTKAREELGLPASTLNNFKQLMFHYLLLEI